MEQEWIGGEGEEQQIHYVCRFGSLADAMALFSRTPSLVRARDLMLQTPLHAACCNHRLYGWKIVKFVLAEYPEAARQVDTLGRLPLHLAAANEGPTHDARGMQLCPDDQEELQEISNNGFEMVSLLLEVFPHAADVRDMDGLVSQAQTSSSAGVVGLAARLQYCLLLRTMLISLTGLT
jgi:ankyrin repeat protein